MQFSTPSSDPHHFEHNALSSAYNLADAHPHAELSPTQAAIISKLPKLWREASKEDVSQLENELIREYFELVGQNPLAHGFKPCITLSALTSINLAAMLCAERKSQVHLLHPTFYKLHDVLKNHGVETLPLPEDVLFKMASSTRVPLSLNKSSVIFLVDVNNPTGSSLSAQLGEKGYDRIAKIAAQTGALVIVDLCFNWFASEKQQKRFDIYEVFRKHGTSFICFEDYGKVAPLAETKVSFMVASDDIVQNLNHLNHGFALNPSPFVMKLGMEFIKDLKAGGLKDALTLVSSNRDYARQALQGTPLHICESLSEPSVLWLQLPANVAAGAFAAQCQQAGVSVMPGNHYFWANPREGDRFIRIACLRDAATFKAGIDLVAEIALIPGLPVDSRQRVANID